MKHIFLLILIAVSAVYAHASDTLVVRDLSVEWYAVNKKGEIEPFDPGNSKVVYFKIPQDTGLRLLIYSPYKIDLWIRDQMISHGLHGQNLFSLDSLKLHFQHLEGLTIYSEEGITPEISTKIIETNASIKLPQKGSLRWISQTHDWYLISLLLLIVLAGFYRRLFPVSFRHAFENPLTFKVRSLSEEDTYLDFGSIDNIFTILFFSALYATNLTYLTLNHQMRFEEGSLTDLGYTWLIILFTASLVVLSKHFWCRLLSFAFDFSGVSNIQVQDYLNFLIPIFSTTLGLTMLDFGMYDFHSEKLRLTVIYALIISQIFFVVWFYLKVDKFYPNKKLLIIIYLCTTEFLPGALTVYWLWAMK